MRRGIAECDDDSGLIAHQLFGERREPLGIGLGKAEIKPQVAILDVAERRQGIANEGHDRLRIGRLVDQQYPNKRHIGGLRRAHADSAEQNRKPGEEALHSMTSSARASNAGGILRPSVLAVPMLMTSSNLVGCSTGRSAGLAPFRILST